VPGQDDDQIDPERGDDGGEDDGTDYPDSDEQG
jgi:hypothetical protein